jgi:hypothetical protein
MVTAEFAQLVVAHQLTGLQFLAPEQDMLRLALGRDLICPFPALRPLTSNPSIERTSSSKLCLLPVAAHVER